MSFIKKTAREMLLERMTTRSRGVSRARGRAGKVDLNKIQLRTAGGGSVSFVGGSTASDDRKTELVTENVKDTLIAEISKADVVAGCVAWINCYDILDALADKLAVSFVVQKERYLRPGRIGAELKQHYEALHSLPYPDWLDAKWTEKSPTIRCAGPWSRSGEHERMHSKFAVFCRLDDEHRVCPYAAWIGSSNFTWTSHFSLETVVVTRDEKLALAAFNRYEQILAMSEPLNWTSAESSPQFQARR